uniref:Uncharacterized protein K0039A02.9 n=1 Tax=Oryza sativa subsp. indica TaxID=39946 RepID=C8TEY7_ORYSI|nr:hypothetical protein [Oryza sativa Indica Group]
MGAGDVGEVELESERKFGEKWGRGWRSGRRPCPHGRMCAREAGGGSFSGDVGRPGLPWRLPAEWLEEGGGADRWGGPPVGEGRREEAMKGLCRLRGRGGAELGRPTRRKGERREGERAKGRRRGIGPGRPKNKEGEFLLLFFLF